MAKQKRRSSSTRKPATKKVPPKRKKRKSKKRTSIKKDLIIFFSVLALIGMAVLGYMLGNIAPVPASKKTNPGTVMQSSIDENKQFIEKIEKAQQKRALQKEEEKREEVLRKARVKKEREEKRRQAELAAKKLAQKEEKRNVIIITDKPVYPEENITYKENKTLPESGKPKLVIIIDDVSSSAQLDHILSLNLKLTPSIFPPYKRSPQNHKLAEGLVHYMIHLPMESGRSFDRQTRTLMVSDSKEMIEARAREIRELFPTARYINNHTGSVFTSNYQKMEILYLALKKEGFVFVDSRTTGSTKVPKIAKKYAQHYLARDIFIDNKLNQAYIHQQLRYVVSKAKKNGYAIAIGHPHKVTLQALANASDILKDVEIVYIDELEKGVNRP
jgi:polysaccharide deacetylase 2 family uncharacterized protein YibQ